MCKQIIQRKWKDNETQQPTLFSKYKLFSKNLKSVIYNINPADIFASGVLLQTTEVIKKETACPILKHMSFKQVSPYTIQKYLHSIKTDIKNVDYI